MTRAIAINVVRKFAVYERIVKYLLSKHSLSVGSTTANMLAKTLIRYRNPPLDRLGVPSKKNIQKALSATRRLSQYAEGVSSANSVSKQCRKLWEALDNPTTWMSLEICEPGVWAPGLNDIDQETSASLSELIESLALVGEDNRSDSDCDRTESAAKLSVAKQVEKLKQIKRNLDSLASVLEKIQSVESAKSGRPKESIRDIVRAGCIAWQRSGRDDSYYNIQSSTTENAYLLGPLANFLKELLAWCKVDATDDALHYAVKAARKDPIIRSLASHT